MPVTDLSPAEMMAVAMSREVNDGEFGGVGASSQIPMAALRLAQLTRTPNLSWFSGASGAVNPRFDRLHESSSDWRNLRRSDARISMEDVVDFECRVRMDFGFLGGMQIDQYGNVNMAFIGDWRRPTVRGPGTVGLIFMARFKKVYLYTRHHDPRIFVEKVDFISGAGFLNGSDERERVVPEGAKGPCLIFTPLGVFDFDEVSKRVRLRTFHPGSSVDEIRKKTGFDVIVPEYVLETPVPTKLELTVLREIVDRDGVLKGLA